MGWRLELSQAEGDHRVLKQKGPNRARPAETKLVFGDVGAQRMKILELACEVRDAEVELGKGCLDLDRAAGQEERAGGGGVGGVLSSVHLSFMKVLGLPKGTLGFQNFYCKFFSCLCFFPLFVYFFDSVWS